MTPGSSSAKMLGCCCSEPDNNFGSGLLPNNIYGRRFIVSESCIIHGMSKWTTPQRTVSAFEVHSFGINAVINQLKSLGHTVTSENISGLYRVDDGPELTVMQLTQVLKDKLNNTHNGLCK